MLRLGACMWLCVYVVSVCGLVVLVCCCGYCMCVGRCRVCASCGAVLFVHVRSVCGGWCLVCSGIVMPVLCVGLVWMVLLLSWFGVC